MKTIIVADDHPITLNGIKTYLESLNYQVIGTYSDGAKAFEGVINLKPHFAILDLNMPEMNGLKVLEELRKLIPKLSFIRCTTKVPFLKEQKPYK